MKTVAREYEARVADAIAVGWKSNRLSTIWCQMGLDTGEAVG